MPRQERSGGDIAVFAPARSSDTDTPDSIISDGKRGLTNISAHERKGEKGSVLTIAAGKVEG